MPPPPVYMAPLPAIQTLVVPALQSTDFKLEFVSAHLPCMLDDLRLHYSCIEPVSRVW
jgi:hypothetical protein